MLEPVVSHMVRRGLRGVWVRGPQPPARSVWAANHHTWWDPFIATALSRAWGRRSAILMQQQNLARFRFARSIGAFGTQELRRGLSYLDSDRSVVVYPEGQLHPAGSVREIARGAAWFARVGRAPLYAVAVRTVLRGQRFPETYVSFDHVRFTGSDRDVTVILRGRLHAALTTLDDQLATEDPRKELPGFTLAVPGRCSPDERIEAWTRRLSWH